AVDVGAVRGRAGILLTTSTTGRALGARVGLRRLDGSAQLTLRLIPSAPWILVPETVTLVDGRGEFTVSINSAAVADLGEHQAGVRLEGPDETAGPLAVVPVAVRVPVPITGTKSPVTLHTAPGAVSRVFVTADSGRGMQLEIATDKASDRA